LRLEYTDYYASLQEMRLIRRCKIASYNAVNIKKPR